MKKFLMEQITRRRFGQIVERLWFALFLVPRMARAQNCCFNVYIDCGWYEGAPNCTGSWGFFAADDYSVPQLRAAYYVESCGWCVTDGGCSWCNEYWLWVYGICCGYYESWSNYICCQDTECCSD